MIDGIAIFDLDGTLFRTETISVPAVQEAFTAHGLESPADDEICAMFGKRSGAYREFLRGRCPDDLAERVETHALRRELELAAEGGELYPGVLDALYELRGTVRHLAICSNGPRRYVETVLTAGGIADLFDDVRYRRPEDESKPQMMHELLASLGLSAPVHGVVTGDRHDDVEAAHANHLRAIGAAYGYGDPGELDDADVILHQPNDLARTVLRMLEADSHEHR
jgi:phosphoglycolate phosphatase-like HAD superfamily hydrolase